MFGLPFPWHPWENTIFWWFTLISIMFFGLLAPIFWDEDRRSDGWQKWSPFVALACLWLLSFVDSPAIVYPVLFPKLYTICLALSFLAWKLYCCEISLWQYFAHARSWAALGFVTSVIMSYAWPNGDLNLASPFIATLILVAGPLASMHACMGLVNASTIAKYVRT